MDAAALTIPAARLSRLEDAWDQPLALVDLASPGFVPRDWRLPPCPVIGIGATRHPLAGALDAVLETGFELDPIVRAVLAQPAAAATLVQVLRTTVGLLPASALTVESLSYAMLQASGDHRAWKAARSAGVPAQAGRVVLERTGEILDVALDRPWSGNAIDFAMRDGLREALELALLDPGVKRVRLRGRGKTFSLGADLDEFGTTNDPARAHAIRMLTLPARVAIECADRLEVHVDGACIGAGLELAAFGARIVATRRSWFQLPELAMGIIPGAGGCVSLPRRIGRQRTALLVLSGRRIGARLARDWGLVDALVDDLSGDEGGRDGC